MTGDNPVSESTSESAFGWIASYLLVIPFAWRGFLLGEHSPFTGDIRHYHHPITQELVRAWQEGRFPLWSDHAFLGIPFFADPQTALLYPGTLLPALLGPHWGYVIFLIVHSLLAAIGMFGLMRSHQVDNLAAWCSGLMVALCGYFAHEAQHPGLFAILCWIPAWLWATYRFMRRPSCLGAVGAAAVVAMMIFAGTLQVLFGALVFYGFYVLGVTADIRVELGTRVAGRRFGLIFATQLLGLSLAAVTLIPAVEHLPSTARALGMTYEFASMGSVHLVEWLGMFVNGSAGWLGAGMPLDHEGGSFYLGSLALPLLVVGLFSQRNGVTSSVAIAVVVLVLIAMGRYGGVHGWLFEQSPGLVGGLRGMGRALGPAAVGIAFLAGFGIQGLVTHADRRWKLAFSVATGVVVAVHVAAFMISGTFATSALWSAGFALTALVASVVATKRRAPEVEPGDAREWLHLVIVGLLAIDLLAFGALHGVTTASPAPPSGSTIPDTVPEFDELTAGAFDYQGERIMLHGFGPLNTPTLQGFDGVGGYNPLVTLQYLDFVQLINMGKRYPREPIDQFVSGSKPQRFDSPLFDTASVRFIVSTRPERTRGLRRVHQYVDSHLAGYGASLYQNEGALPRAYLTDRTRRAVDAVDLEKQLSRGFDPYRTTVVEGNGPVLNGSGAIRPVARTRHRPEHLSFDVGANSPSVLVVTDSWHEGWRAWVDDEETSVFRVNAMFRGVAIPAGAKRVDMRFVPTSFQAGSAISFSALALLLLLGGLGIRSQRSV